MFSHGFLESCTIHPTSHSLHVRQQDPPHYPSASLGYPGDMSDHLVGYYGGLLFLGGGY